jgi:hypothetical protein
LSYPEDTMSSKQEKQPLSMRRFCVEAFVVGCVISGTLFFLGAPIWAFYLAGFPALPFLFLRLPQVDPEAQVPTEWIAEKARGLRHRGRLRSSGR